jgi:predicted ATPase/DNA-binding SARP family transcriptional activator/Tfp pilus assembly protein PilF
MSEFRLSLLGAPALEKDGKPVQVGRRKAVALLAYLAVTGKAHSRETLATLLWPDSEPSLAYSYLRRDLSVLNKKIGEGWLDVTRESVALVEREDFWLDVEQFRRLLAAREAHGHPIDAVCPRCMPLLSEAVDLYRDDFMAGFTLPDALDFDEWQYFESEGLRGALTGALKRLVEGHSAEGEFEQAIDCARRWLGLDPWHEPAHRELMQLYTWAGNKAAATRQYQECVRVLEEELGQPPEEATRELYEAIRANQVPAPPSWMQEPGAMVASVEEGAATSRPELPAQLTPFIDREEELEEIRTLLHEPGCRMLTLIGSGGIGKSRLAVEVAGQEWEAFANGVCFVALVSVSGVDLLVPTIADALKLSFQGQADLKAQLLNYLREKEMLLVLDNFEHVLEGAELLVEILASASKIKLLITSRERLNLRAEFVREIGGLTYPSLEELELAQAERLVPAPEGGRGVVPVEDYHAVRLFLENARRVRPAFSLSEADRRAVVQICQMVEGMPLALELAAVWVGMMPCPEIAEEVKWNINFLSTSLRDVPARHRSLRALFEHSWGLLSEAERGLVRRLAVFKGGFWRDAAEQVAGASLSLLAALVQKSMLRGHRSGRYDMQEILRQYATDKLLAVPMESVELQDKHCSYYLTFLEAREIRLKGNGQEQAAAEIATDIDNVRTAWRWAVKQRRVAELGRGLESLHLFYFTRSWYQEGAEAFREAAGGLKTALRGRPPSLVLGQLLARQGRFVYRLGRYQEAQGLLEESLTILRELETQGHPDLSREIAFGLFCLSVVLRGDGQYREAEKMCQQSLMLYRESGDRFGMAMALKLLGIIAGSRGRYEEAQHLLHEALGHHQVTGNDHGIADILNDLGIVAVGMGQHEEATRLYRECLAMRRESGHVWGIGTALNNLGYLAYLRGDYAEAKGLLEESLVIQKEIGDRYNIANCLSNLGAATCALAQYQEARKHFGEALRIALDIGADPLVLEILTEIATLLAAKEGEDKGQATELFAVVTQHPASARPTRDKAEQGLAELAAQVPSKVLTKAKERGKQIELEAFVTEVLGQQFLARGN